MNEMQTKLFENFKWLINFMNENGIRYYVIGGTMLGAVRHKGFIPWDDDIDIGIPRSDYEKLIKLFDKQIDDYILESPKNDDKEYLYNFAKVYDVRTTMIEHLKKDVVRGVYIDVFPLDGMGDDYDQAIKDYKKIDKKNMLLAVKTTTHRKGRKWWKNLASKLGWFIPLNCKKATKAIDEMSAKRNFDDCKYVGNLVGTARFKEIMPREFFGKPTKYEFEGMEVTGPEKYDEYLTKLYKNWRQLPPEDKRYTAHDFIYLDLKNSWYNYKK